MHHVFRSTQLLAAFAAFMLVIGLCCPSQAQESSITFDNQSGDSALVKLVGPTPTQIEVPPDENRTVTAGPGKYHIRVRYGAPGEYRYTKGEEFDVTESTTTRSRISITLHKVPDGNYETETIAEENFVSALSTFSASFDLSELKDGPWQGRNETQQGFLEVSFLVDNGKSLLKMIKIKGGMTGVPNWSWPTHDDASTKIQSDGSFSYKDSWGNLIRGRFTSAESAEGEVPVTISTKGADGQVIRPPSQWHTSPSTQATTPLISNLIDMRYRWRTKWNSRSAANGITVTDTEVLADGKRRQSVEGSIPIVNSQMVIDAPGSKNIKIAITPKAGSTWYAGLVFKEACVLGILENFTLIADKTGLSGKDRDGNFWRSAKATIDGKDVFAFVRD